MGRANSRTRDRRCRITGITPRMAYEDQGMRWAGLNGAHIIGRSAIPYVCLLYRPTNWQWQAEGLYTHVSASSYNQGRYHIDSVQNCICLSTAVHPDWDHYLVSIDIEVSPFASSANLIGKRLCRFLRSAKSFSFDSCRKSDVPSPSHLSRSSRYILQTSPSIMCTHDDARKQSNLSNSGIRILGYG